MDTTNNNTCDNDAWYPNGAMTTKLIEGLSAGTYYWQVKVDTDTDYELNGGTWWSFTVGAGSASGTGPATVAREYVYLGSRLLASIEAGTTTTYYHPDILGSVRAITNASGSTVTRHDFFPFGENGSSLGGDPRRFLGQQQDAETAFDHLGARYYRNVWGRFTSVDPIFSEGATSNPQLWNRYAYALNGPLRYRDPSGLAPTENEPVMESDASISGFTLAEFNKAAHANYMANMMLGFQAGIVSFESMMNTLSPEGRSEFRRNVMISIGLAAMPIYIATGILLPGGFREAGFVAYLNSAGSQVSIAQLAPSPWTLPGNQSSVSVSLTKYLWGDPKQIDSTWTMGIAFHVHPGGVTRSAVWRQASNGGDHDAINPDKGGLPYGLGIVFGARDERMYFYNGSGQFRTMSQKDFFGVLK